MIHVINPKFKVPEDAVVINTTSRSPNWSKELSPFFLGPVDLYDGYVSQNMENAWQFSKVYYNHIDQNENPTEDYFKWAKRGWTDTYAHRYPMGKGIKPLYSYWNGQKLTYIEARKQIYIPLYATAVQKTHAWKMLQEAYAQCILNDKTLYLWDFDAHSLTPGTFDYWALWNNDQIKVGHGYVLAMLLEGIIK